MANFPGVKKERQPVDFVLIVAHRPDGAVPLASELLSVESVVVGVAGQEEIYGCLTASGLRARGYDRHVISLLLLGN
jgi:hypothetical protein